MKELYKTAFDKFELTEAKKNEIRRSLSSDSPAVHTRRYHKAAVITTVAASFALLLLAIPSTRAGIVKAAEYVRNVFTLSDGTEVIMETESESTAVTIETDALTENKYYEVSDNRLYFVLDDTRIDITDKCSDSTCFRYDMTDSNGYTHIIFVGGDIDSVGWAEFVFDSNGTYLTNLMSVPMGGNWLDAAMASIGVPTGNPQLDFSE